MRPRTAAAALTDGTLTPRPMRLLALTLLTLPLAACSSPDATARTDAEPAPSTAVSIESLVEPDTAVFAGGCFWCMEPPFEKLDGVAAVISGFDGGTTPNPTYKEVSAGATDYAETVQVIFDRSKVSYEKLLDVYWHNVDPFSADGQFCDRGLQYRPAIYYLDAEQRAAAEASRDRLQAGFEQPFVVEIEPATGFYAAEAYHQDFYKTNPDHYKQYRRGCRRDARLIEVWGTDADV